MAGMTDDQNRTENAEEEHESVHFREVLASFAAYRAHSLRRIAEMETHMARLDRRTQEALRCEDKFSALKRAVDINASGMIEAILEPHTVFEEGPSSTLLEQRARADLHGGKSARSAPSEASMDKVRSTIKQFVRDWAEEGAPERLASYGPLLADLERLFPRSEAAPSARQCTTVLVPGAGLGRLAWEAASRGFAAQGNECSYHMLLASNLILNHATERGQLTIYPFVHQTCNVRCAADQLRPVSVPDVAPADLPEGVAFSMCAGDFVGIYGSQRGAWDCVVTCFFVDTARDVSAYVRTIFSALKPGGVWLNLGPLLWHYADRGPSEFSIELTWEELRALILAEGFEMELEEWLSSTYAVNPRAMLHSVYECVHAVFRKPAAPSGATGPRLPPDSEVDRRARGAAHE